MVSAQIAGKLRFYRVTPTGSKTLIYGNDVAALAPSGSSEGAIGSTPEKWLDIKPLNSPEKILRVNDILEVTFEAKAAKTSDASDSSWALPITLAGGTRDSLGDPSDAGEWDHTVMADLVFIAGVETPICKKTVRKPFALGGGKWFTSIEDNA